MNITKKENRQPQGVARYQASPSPFSLIDRFFDDSIFDPFNMMTPSLFRTPSMASISNSFPKVDVKVDVLETDKEIRVIANVPGVDKDKIDIEVGDDYLSLSGKIEKENKEEDKQGKVYRYEREFGEFRREFSLPARVNREGIVAKMKNGVLNIILPKMEDEKKAKIKIDTE
jgi:HSP20 family protein